MKPEVSVALSDVRPVGERPFVPSRYVPHVLLAAAALQLLAAEFALEGPWTAERVFMVISVLLSLLVGGSVQGVRR